MGGAQTKSKSPARQANARRQPRVGGKFAGKPRPASEDKGPPPAPPPKPARTGKVEYPPPADAEPTASAAVEEPPEQGKSAPKKPTASRSRSTGKRTASRTASRSKKDPPTPPVADERKPARRGILAELAEGIRAPFGGA